MLAAVQAHGRTLDGGGGGGSGDSGGQLGALGTHLRAQLGGRSLESRGAEPGFGGTSGRVEIGSGNDTPDGTCVRDYIHVSDLAEAHLLAVRYLEGCGCSATLNPGNGRGFSVREVAEAMRKVSGRDFPVLIGPRRLGDKTL